MGTEKRCPPELVRGRLFKPGMTMGSPLTGKRGGGHGDVNEYLQMRREARRCPLEFTPHLMRDGHDKYYFRAACIFFLHSYIEASALWSISSMSL